VARFIPVKNRFNYYKVAPEALENVMQMEMYVRKIKLDPKLKELIKLLASLINGCPFCIQMHTKGARKLKATDEEINELREWQQSSQFTDEEKMAFELTERITLISESGVSDELYERARQYYDEREYFDLIFVITQVNTWNRIAILMGNEP